MWELVLAGLFTLAGSAVCSTIEAMLLSTTVAEIEALKARSPRAGALFEECREGLEESISAILTMNTLANTLGSFICGALASKIFPDGEFAFALGMTLGILIFGEILPKNIGVLFRTSLQPWLVRVLHAMRLMTRPLSWVMRPLINLLIRWAKTENNTSAEIALLAQREVKEGNLTQQESSLIANALKLDEVFIRDIMTPRSVVTALEKGRTVTDVFREMPAIPHARMPVFGGNQDNIVGLARRRDLLKAKAADQHQTTVGDLMQAIVFVPDSATAETTLQQFLKYHQQMAVVVDEYGAMAGVVSLEDIFEHLLGREIFEKDDMAVDMRELARRRQRLPSFAAAAEPGAPAPASEIAHKSG